MLTKQEFDNLTIAEKAMLVFESGEAIGSRTKQSVTIKLYTLIDFYVEVYYLPFTNKIDRIVTGNLEDIAGFYTDQIDISDLFN
jgi:uncharacterized alkaline shock family protein YloU